MRLVHEDPTGKDPEKGAIKALFNHRLSSDGSLARLEWLDIVDGSHALWTPITSSKREVIRSFLNTVNMEIIKRSRPTSAFNHQSASVGNLFLTGARLFTSSFESSIYLLGSIMGVPANVNVIPAINTNFSHHISAGLEDGTVITGQNAISHPTPTITPEEDETHAGGPITQGLSFHDAVEDATPPGSLPTLRKQNISFSKAHASDLPSRISRIWYINPYGQEMRPAANPAALQVLHDASCIIYSIGSLYTSIIPCLVLRDVGSAIASRCVPKVLLLNGTTDRETRAVGMEFGARDFVKAIADACDSSRGEKGTWSDYVTHVVHLRGDGTPSVETEELAGVGVKCVGIPGLKTGVVDGEGGMVYDGPTLGDILRGILNI